MLTFPNALSRSHYYFAFVLFIEKGRCGYISSLIDWLFGAQSTYLSGICSI